MKKFKIIVGKIVIFILVPLFLVMTFNFYNSGEPLDKFLSKEIPGAITSLILAVITVSVFSIPLFFYYFIIELFKKNK